MSHSKNIHSVYFKFPEFDAMSTAFSPEAILDSVTKRLQCLNDHVLKLSEFGKWDEEAVREEMLFVHNSIKQITTQSTEWLDRYHPELRSPLKARPIDRILPPTAPNPLKRQLTKAVEEAVDRRVTQRQEGPSFGPQPLNMDAVPEDLKPVANLMEHYINSLDQSEVIDFCQGLFSPEPPTPDFDEVFPHGISLLSPTSTLVDSQEEVSEPEVIDLTLDDDLESMVIDLTEFDTM